ncbi:MAG: VWA domain-containing protein, partial [Chloroflexota bacterium]
MPVVAAPIALAADTAYLAPDSTVAPNGWTGGGNATDGTDDGVYATASGDNVDQGYRDFSFGLPHGSIIDGITVKANAFSSDASGCRLSARVSWNDGGSWSDRQTLNLNGDAAAVLSFGSATSTWGHTWDPTQTTNSSFRLEIRNEDPGSSCSGTTSLDWVTASVAYRTINDGTANPALGSEICEAADFNFVIDMSGSIGAQGGTPSNLPDLKAGVTGFVTAFQNAGGDGRYSGTRFNASGTASLTSGYTDAATFNDAVNALGSPSGLTPTAAGINAGAANNAHDRAGVPNVMFVVTDGSPNVPGGDLDSPSTWLQAANAAVAAADAARAGSGASRYVVKAVYLSTPGDPGDTSLPFSSAGDSQWATEVMDRIGGGSHFDADFSAFVNDLFEAIGCEPPSTTIEKQADDASVNAGDQIGFTITVRNSGGSAAHDVVVDDNLPDSAGTDWSISPAVAGCSISGSPGDEALHCDFGTIAAGAHESVHVVTATGKACGVYDNSATFDSSDGGSGQASDSVNVKCASIDVEKQADDASVSAGDQIGFLITVASNGPGAAKGVVLTDTLPTDAGTSWSIAGGTGAGQCAIAAGVLSCDFGTMASGTSLTVHIVSPTTKATLADSPVANTAVVTTTNDGGDEDGDQVAILAGSIDVQKVADDASVSVGDQVGFLITVTSTGPGAAKGVMLTDTLPTDAGTSWSIAGGTGAGQCAIDAGVLSCDFGRMEKDDAYTVHIVSPTSLATLADSPVVNSAVVTTTNDGSDEAHDQVAILAGSIDVEKQADDASVSAGDQIGFLITVASNGPGAAKGVVLTDTLPTDAGTSWSIAGGTGAGQCAIAAGVLSCDFGTMASGTSLTVHIVSPTTKATLADSPVANTAVVTTTNDGGDEDGDQVVVLGPDLEVVKSGNGAINAGATATFTITVFNHGPGVAHDVALSDQLPEGAWSLGGASSAACSIDGANLLTCDFGSLDAGASRLITVSRSTTAVDCGRIPNEAIATASNEDTATDQYANSDGAGIVVACPDLAVTKTGNGPVSAGENAEFTIVVTNLGPGAASGVTLVDELPAGIDWVVGGADAAGCEVIDGTLSCAFGTLEANASRTVTLTGETDAPDCGTVPNTATVSATNEPAGATANNASTASVAINCPAMLITKTADDPEVSAGDQIGFTVTVSNSGNGSVLGLAVDDLLPAGFTWSIESQSGGWAIAGGHLTWGPGTLASGGSISVHIVSATSPAACGSVTNAASFVTSNDGTGSDEAVVTIECPNVTVDKTAGASPILAGQTAAYTITVTNQGPGIARDVTLTDELAAGHDWVQDNERCSIEGNVLSCELGDLEAGASQVIHLSTTVSVEDCGRMVNVASVAAGNEAPADTEDNTDSAVVEVQCVAIDIVKTAGTADDGEELVAGAGDVLFSYLVTNPGTAALVDVAVVDDHGTPDDASDDVVVTCPQTTLAAGASMTCTATIAVGEGVTTNVATVTGSPVLGEGEVSASDDAVVRVPQLTIDKSIEGGIEAALEGDILTFTLAYDLTDGPVTDGIITDVLPEGLVYLNLTATDS